MKPTTETPSGATTFAFLLWMLSTCFVMAGVLVAFLHRFDNNGNKAALWTAVVMGVHIVATVFSAPIWKGNRQ